MDYFLDRSSALVTQIYSYIPSYSSYSCIPLFWKILLLRQERNDITSRIAHLHIVLFKV